MRTATSLPLRLNRILRGAI